MRPDLRDRILPRLIIEPQTGCLLWTGGRSSAGYGQVKNPDGTTLVHRLMYEWLTGPIPDGMQIDHLCRVRHCASPAHLEAVTQSVNLRRGFAVRPRRTACPHGHPFDAANTYIKPGTTYQYCRTCNKAAVRRYRADVQKLAAEPNAEKAS